MVLRNVSDLSAVRLNDKQEGDVDEIEKKITPTLNNYRLAAGLNDNAFTELVACLHQSSWAAKCA